VNNKKPHINTTHQYFTWKPIVGENHRILLLYVKRSTFIGSTNFLVFQLQLEGCHNPLNSHAPTWRKPQIPYFFGTKQKEATTPFPFLVPPPWNISATITDIATVSLTLSICPYETYHCKTYHINWYQQPITICINDLSKYVQLCLSCAMHIQTSINQV